MGNKSALSDISDRYLEITLQVPFSWMVDMVIT